MSENNNTLLEKLDGLVARFEEVSTLITDPSVIADQKRYVKLTKEYKELSDIMKARREYIQCLNGLEEAKMMMGENDPELKEMAREEAAACEARIPELEEEIKLLLIPRLEAGSIECQRRRIGRIQGNHLLRYGRKGVRNSEIRIGRAPRATCARHRNPRARTYLGGICCRIARSRTF